MKGLHIVAFTLLVIGGLNWLAQGLFGVELGEYLGGMSSGVSRAIYVLVGLAAIFEIATHKGRCRGCGGSNAPAI